MSKRDLGSDDEEIPRMVEAPPDWATKPRTLEHSTLFLFTIPAYDLLLCLAPVIFIAYVFVAVYLNGKAVDDHKWGLEAVKASRYGVTIYTILFASIAGRSMEFVSSWLVEQGASIYLLEQLLGSVSVFGTVRTQWLLRATNFVSLALLLFWAMSPLGGQGTLRALDTTPLNESAIVGRLLFMKTSIDSPIFQKFNSSSPTIDHVFRTVSWSAISDTIHPGDFWGNPKIPKMKALKNLGDNLTVPAGFGEYAAMIGIPTTSNLSQSPPKYGYMLNATFCSLECPEAAFMSNRHRLNVFTMSTNGSKLQVDGSFFQDGRYINNITTICNLRVDDVQATVQCLESECRATSVRLLQSRALTNTSRIAFFRRYSKFTVEEQIQGIMYGECLADHRNVNECHRSLWSKNQVSGTFFEYFQSRVGFFITSYFYAVAYRKLWHMKISPEDGQSQELTRLLQNESVLQTDKFGLTHITQFSSHDHYVAHTLWLTLLFLSSTILCIMAIVGTVMKYLAAGPELLGHVSTLTREIRSFELSAKGTALSGFERARLMKKTYIQLADLQPDADTGRLGFVASGREQKGNIIRNRFYE